MPEKNIATSNSFVKVTIEPSEPKDFIPKLAELQDKSMNMSRMSEQGIVNEKTGSSVVVRENGQINLSSSKYSQVKISPTGRIIDTSLESVTTTNRKKFIVDEFIINEHKMNPQLWEYADFRTSKLLTNEHAIVGNLCMSGTILVKAWEPNLKRYVLIRRPWRGPVFGTLLNVPEINSALDVDDPLKIKEDILALSEKGYQVNGIIKDAKSLIGKAGVDREGIVRTGSATDSATGTYGKYSNDKSVTNSGSLGGGNIDPFDCWKILRKAGYNEISAAAILGNIQQESSFNTEADNGSYKGLAQWGKQPGDRWEHLVNWANSHGRNPMDGATQMDYLVYEAKNERYPDQCCPEKMNSLPDIAAANRQWVQWFEGATDGNGGYQEETERREYAVQFYNKFTGKL